MRLCYQEKPVGVWRKQNRAEKESRQRCSPSHHRLSPGALQSHFCVIFVLYLLLLLKTILYTPARVLLIQLLKTLQLFFIALTVRSSLLTLVYKTIQSGPGIPFQLHFFVRFSFTFILRHISHISWLLNHTKNVLALRSLFWLFFLSYCHSGLSLNINFKDKLSWSTKHYPFLKMSTEHLVLSVLFFSWIY